MKIVKIKQGAVDEFSYGIEHTPPSGQKYDIIALVSSMSLVESLFNKALGLQLVITDGAGYMETVGMTVGDKINLVVQKENLGEEARTIEVEMRVAGVTGEAMRVGAREKTYVVSCVSLAAFQNSRKKVSRSFRGTAKECLIDLFQKELEVTVKEDQFEDTFGAVDFISPWLPAFGVADQFIDRSLSTDQTRIDNLFMLYEQIGDGHKFKTVRKIIEDAKTHEYTFYPSQVRAENTDDFFRAMAWKQHSRPQLETLMSKGVVRSAAQIVDPIGRRFINEKFDLNEEVDKLVLLGKFVPFNLEKAVELLPFNGSSPLESEPHVRTVVSEESYNRVELFGRKYAATQAQRELIGSTCFTMKVHGNPDLRAGDIVEMTVPIMYQNDVRGDNVYDQSFGGKFIVANVRHNITQADAFETYVDLFKDAYERQQDATKSE
jgi:hypothetical protein